MVVLLESLYIANVRCVRDLRKEIVTLCSGSYASGQLSELYVTYGGTVRENNFT